MSRSRKIWTWSGLGLLAVLVIAVALLLTFDWNRAKPWLNSRVSAATGRVFTINGNLSLTWEKESVPESGWRSWLPWPHLIAQEITIGNPEWAKAAANTVELKQVAFSVNPLALLDKRIVIPSLRFDSPSVTLERAKDGKNNWYFKSGESPSEWKLELQQLVLTKGNVRIVDAIKRADIMAVVDTLPQDAVYGVGWTMSGTFNGQKLTGDGKAGAVLSLQTQSAPYPIEASVRIGKTSGSVKGTLTKPRDLAALDMQLKLAGASMAHLYPLTGLVLPETPPYSTNGHLVGTLNAKGGDWLYEKFSGKVGASDIGGTLEYQSKEPRPLLKGTVTSKVLQFDDLAPLIGADSTASKAKRDAVEATPSGKVLPAEPFKTERWSSIDADVKFTGQRIIRDKDLPIDNLSTNLRLQDGVLSLKPLNFGVAGGTFNSDITLDGRNKIIKAQLKIAARHLKLKQLFPAFQPMQASLGEVNGDASLSATGNSIASMLGSSNGEVKALINDGTISKLLLEQIGLNIGNVVLSKIFGDKQVKLHCLASDFAVTNGLMQARSFVVDTDEAILTLTGQINLAQEQLALTI
ncbi:MAG: AsmA family protein, partial [Herminiimonas sp.]|nr:AsmA family protein [Herminiimonas sp.]